MDNTNQSVPDVPSLVSSPSVTSTVVSDLKSAKSLESSSPQPVPTTTPLGVPDLAPHSEPAPTAIEDITPAGAPPVTDTNISNQVASKGSENVVTDKTSTPLVEVVENNTLTPTKSEPVPAVPMPAAPVQAPNPPSVVSAPAAAVPTNTPVQVEPPETVASSDPLYEDPDKVKLAAK